jgi:hypothetical protein
VHWKPQCEGKACRRARVENVISSPALMSVAACIVPPLGIAGRHGPALRTVTRSAAAQHSAASGEAPRRRRVVVLHRPCSWTGCPGVGRHSAIAAQREPHSQASSPSLSRSHTHTHAWSTPPSTAHARVLMSKCGVRCVPSHPRQLAQRLHLLRVARARAEVEHQCAPVVRVHRAARLRVGMAARGRAHAPLARARARAPCPCPHAPFTA